MENNINNKAKFFALYFGQNFVHTGEGRPIKALGNEIVMNYENSDKFQLCCYSNQRAVELKPLSSITDEDAIEVARIVCVELFIKDRTPEVDRSEAWVTVKHKWSMLSVDIDPDGYVSKFHEEEEYRLNPYHVHASDFLRSKGYALPYMGLSVEKQIEYGWIRLTK